MENMLYNLFDFQKFEGNERIDSLIEKTQEQFGVDIKLEDLDQITAAGSLIPPCNGFK